MSELLTPTRRYRGTSSEERQALRRQQLIEAAIQVYGQQGYHQATVKAVCAAAGLTERYFYESFASSEDLLIDCFNAVTFTLYEEIRQAARAVDGDQLERARAMLHTYFSALEGKPASARVFLVEMRGVSRRVDEAFDATLRAIRPGLAEVIALTEGQPDDLLVEGILGGIIQIALRWIAQGYQPSLDEVTETALRLVGVFWQKL